ncbi:multiple monosaccharide ABC transporter membrane protein [Paraburkholderia fungorum]|uniref:Xylose transport system permease protein XylH n=1 Tax=Paraburkholderia fungorum TaxID=134537 RepID=A0A1H1JP19_9BURK|nr:multiple monosaccharide ABC transporter permease [Paraburkholderia fungorum]SDR51690.1 multiple monosaccharide ABC transporter membrane protein [Paraburkholderia fungorum]
MSNPLTTPASPEPQGGKLESVHALKRGLREYGLLVSLVIIMGFFQVSTNATLMQPLNLTNLILQNSYIVIMALGMLMVIVAGHIDLSVGSTSGFIGALAAVLMVQLNVDPILGTVICVAAGALIGAAQGYFVAFWRMPSFIVTLAGMLVFRGLTITLLQGQSIGPFPDVFAVVSSGFIPDFFHGQNLRITSLALGLLVGLTFFYIEFRHRAKATAHGVGTSSAGMFIAKNVVLTAFIVYFSYLLASYRGMPTVLIIMGVLIGAYTFVMNRTTIGRRIYAVGGNVKAAKLSGINTERVSFYTFINMGILAALAGLIFAARLNSATPKAGTGFELDVIAACFIGGASASGGVGKVMGAVIGAFIMGVMNNGMSIMGIGIDYQQVIKGLVLLAAVFIDVYNKNKIS